MRLRRSLLRLLAVPVLAVALAGCTGLANTDADTGQAPMAEPGRHASPAAEPISAPGWVSADAPDFEPKHFEGDGDEVLALPKGATAGVITAHYSGAQNFIVAVLVKGGAQSVALGINHIGAYRGTVAYGLGQPGETPAKLRVMAVGAWSVTVKPLSTVKKLPKAGRGDGVFRYTGAARTVDVAYRGDRGFTVREFGRAPIASLRIEQVGRYRGESAIDAGPAIVTVRADGRWSIR